jgi:7-carboxy-7-deazaguanine synthase
LKISEIFTSIQGESTHAGLLCTFIRLSACNLRCSYCDTQYAYHEGSDLTENDIVDQVRQAGIHLVEITGGEPLLQRGVYPLTTRLLDEGYRVLLETNGSMSIQDLDKRIVVILDIKTPGSGMSERMDLTNLEMIKHSDEIKFVLTGRNDYEWTKEMIRAHNLTDRCTILLSPTFGTLQPEDLAAWMIQDRIGARLNLQLHKYIFGPERRGV